MKTNEEIKQEALNAFIEKDAKKIREKEEEREKQRRNFVEINFPDAIVKENDIVELAGEDWEFGFQGRYRGAAARRFTAGRQHQAHPSLSREVDGKTYVIRDMGDYGEYCWLVKYESERKERTKKLDKERAKLSFFERVKRFFK